VYTRNILNFVNYLRKKYIILHIFLFKSGKLSAIKPYKFDILYNKHKVKYSTDYFYKMGMSRYVNHGSVGGNFNYPDIIIRREARLKAIKFEHYQVMMWDSYLRVIYRSYLRVRYLFTRLMECYNIIVNIIAYYKFYMLHIGAVLCSDRRWLILVSKLRQHSKYVYSIFLGNKNAFKSYRNFRNFIYYKHILYTKSLVTLSSLLRQVKKNSTVSRQITYTEPSTSAKILSTFFGTGIGQYVGTLYSVNRMYSTRVVGIYNHIQYKLSKEMCHIKSNMFSKFVADISSSGDKFQKNYFLNYKINMYFFLKLYKVINSWYGSCNLLFLYILSIYDKVSKILIRYKVLLRLILVRIHSTLYFRYYVDCIKRLKMLSILLVQCKYMLYLALVFSKHGSSSYYDMNSIKCLSVKHNRVRDTFKSIGCIGHNICSSTKKYYLRHLILGKLHSYSYMLYNSLYTVHGTNSVLTMFGSICTFKIFCMFIRLLIQKITLLRQVELVDYVYISNLCLHFFMHNFKSTQIVAPMNMRVRNLTFYLNNYNSYLGDDDLYNFNMLYIYRSNNTEIFRHSLFRCNIKYSTISCLYNDYVYKWYRSFNLYHYNVFLSSNMSYYDSIKKVSESYKYMSYIFNFMHMLKIFSYEFSNTFFGGNSYRSARHYLTMVFIFRHIYLALIVKLKCKLYMLSAFIKNRYKSALIHSLVKEQTNKYAYEVINAEIKPSFCIYFPTYYKYCAVPVNLGTRIDSLSGRAVLQFNYHRISIIKFAILKDRICRIENRRKYLVKVMLNQGLKFDYFVDILTYTARNTAYTGGYIFLAKKALMRRCKLYNKGNVLMQSIKHKAVNIYGTNNNNISLSPYLLCDMDNENTVQCRAQFYNVRMNIWPYIMRDRRNISNVVKIGHITYSDYMCKLYIWKYFIYSYVYNMYTSDVLCRYLYIVYTYWVCSRSKYRVHYSMFYFFNKVSLFYSFKSTLHDYGVVNINNLKFVNDYLLLSDDTIGANMLEMCNLYLVREYNILYSQIFNNFSIKNESISMCGFYLCHVIGILIFTKFEQIDVLNIGSLVMSTRNSYYVFISLLMKSLRFIMCISYDFLLVNVRFIYYLYILSKVQCMYFGSAYYRFLILKDKVLANFMYELLSSTYISISTNIVILNVVRAYIRYIYHTSYAYYSKLNTSFCFARSVGAVYFMNYMYRRSLFHDTDSYNYQYHIFANSLLMRKLYKLHKVFYKENIKRSRMGGTYSYGRKVQFIFNLVYTDVSNCVTKLQSLGSLKMLRISSNWKYFLYPHMLEFRRNRSLGLYNIVNSVNQMSYDWSSYMCSSATKLNYWYSKSIYERSCLNTILEFCNMFSIFNRIYMPLMFEDYLFLFLLYMLHKYIDNYIFNFFSISYSIGSIDYYPQIYTNEDYLDPPVVDPDFVAKYIQIAIKKEDTLYEAISEVRVWISRRNERRRTIVRMYKVGWKTTTSRIKDRPLQYSSVQGQSKYGVFGIKVWVFLHNQHVRGYVK